MTLLLTHFSRGKLLRYTAQRFSYSTAANKAHSQGRVIFESLPGRAVRMLKFMSLSGSIIACTATLATTFTQSQGELSDVDLGTFSLALASTVSVVSTIAVTKMFGPFVTRIIMLPQKQQAIRKGVQLDKHGLPKFDSILRSTMKDGSVGRDTELVIESPGLLGIDTRRTRVCVGDLMGSGRRYRTWDLKPSVVEERRGRGEKVPLETFTILWKSLADSPTKNTMREINNLVGSK